MQNIVILFLILSGINSHMEPQPVDDGKKKEDMEQKQDVKQNEGIVAPPPEDAKKNEDKVAAQHLEVIRKNVEEVTQNMGKIISIPRENYYELLIADHIIELILCISEKCGDGDHESCKKNCQEDFKKLTDTVEIDPSVYDKVLDDSCRNPDGTIKQSTIWETLKSALPNPIKIKNGDSEYGYSGKYGPKGEKGPFGPYGINGPFRTHKHELLKYGRMKKLECKYVKKNLAFLKLFNIKIEENSTLSTFIEKCGLSNLIEKGDKIEGKRRRLVDPLIDLTAICEYIYGFFGFDTSNCED